MSRPSLLVLLFLLRSGGVVIVTSEEILILIIGCCTRCGGNSEIKIVVMPKIFLRISATLMAKIQSSLSLAVAMTGNYGRYFPRWN